MRALALAYAAIVLSVVILWPLLFLAYVAMRRRREQRTQRCDD